MAEVLKNAKLCFLQCDSCKVDMANTQFKRQEEPEKNPTFLYICPKCNSTKTEEKNYPFLAEIEGHDSNENIAESKPKKQKK